MTEDKRYHKAVANVEARIAERDAAEAEDAAYQQQLDAEEAEFEERTRDQITEEVNPRVRRARESLDKLYAQKAADRADDSGAELL